MYNSELGRGPFEFSVVEVGSTALTEKFIDLPLGTRGFMVRARSTTAVLRVSNEKGEVSKMATADPKPKFWTVQAGEVFEIGGIRIMQTDAQDDVGNALGAQTAGTILEQRFYVTSETANVDIEVIVIPGH